MKRVLTFILIFSSTSIWGQFIEPGDSSEETIIPLEPDVEAGIVQNLTGKVSGSAVELSWVNTGVDDDLVIARSFMPITTEEQLLRSLSVGTSTHISNSFRDVSVPNGKWFYAVLSRKSILEKKVILTLGQNTLAAPMQVGLGKKGLKIAQVSLLFAQKTKKGSVRISWKGISAPNVIYNVYRSTNRLVGEASFGTAQKIAIIKNGQTFFEDNKLPRKGDYYYAVTTSLPGGIEDFNLVLDQSTLRTPILVSAALIPIVENLIGRRLEDGKISLTWRDAKTANNISYEIYRSNKPMTPDAVYSEGVMIAKVATGKESFIDTVENPADFYYAIATVSADGRRSNAFIPGKNLIESALSSKNISPKDKEDTVSKVGALSAHSLDQGIKLTWQIKNLENARSIQIYRFRADPTTMQDFRKGSLVARLGIFETEYKDMPPKGSFYYAIFAETKEGLRPPGFFQGVNKVGPYGGFETAEELFKNENNSGNDLDEDFFKEEPQEKATPPSMPRTSPETINRVLRETYLRKSFQAAVDALAIYRSDKDLAVRAKAMFYTGLSYYRLGKYSEAVDYFVKPEVRKAYAKQSRFWYRKSLENL